MRAWILAGFFMAAFAAQAFGVGEIHIDGVGIQEKPPFQYFLNGTVSNQTTDIREVVLRGQVVFYDRTAPKGDLPVRVLRKDITLILRPSESRNVQMQFFLEGNLPKTPLRVEPVLRQRRQRIWEA
jgi:hypothetical protein